MQTLTDRNEPGHAINFNLERFLTAQETVYEQVLAELRDGQKLTEWMWFIFPQIKGLCNSPLALHFGIGTLDEAAAYLAHPVLGARLVECTRLANRIQDNTAYQIFGTPDDLGFQASMTLFDCISRRSAAFHQALFKFFDGEPDPLTLAMLR